MSRNFKFFAYLALFLFSANFAFALTCRNDYSGTSGCAGNKNAAGNCETLGYYTSDVANCGHYIYCPFDTSYKRCTTLKNSSDCSDYPLTKCPDNGICNKCPTDETYKKLTGCKSGYTLNATKTACIENTCPIVEFEVNTSSSTSVTVKVQSTTSQDISKCGSTEAKGWELYNTNTYSGNYLCYACKPKSCPDGYTTEISSQDDCTGSHEQFVAASTSFGNDICGKCQTASSITTCDQHGYQDSMPNIGYLCKSVQLDLGYSSLSTCYDCVACENAGLNTGAVTLTSTNDCTKLCHIVSYSSTAMAYNSATTAMLQDEDGRRGRCYTWQGGACSYGTNAECYCQSGQAINSCNGY